MCCVDWTVFELIYVKKPDFFYPVKGQFFLLKTKDLNAKKSIV